MAARGARAAAAKPVIGVLNGQAPDTYAHLMAALRKGLIESGYVQGQNLAIDEVIE